MNTRINSLCITVAAVLWLRRSALVLAVCLASQPTLAANSPALTSAERGGIISAENPTAA